MKLLRNLLWCLVYALPAILFFSYHPIIALGSNSSMNFELSLPLLWLIIFDLLSFITMCALFIKKRKITSPSKSVNPTSLKSVSKSHRKSSAASVFQAPVSPKHRTDPWGPHLPGLTDRRFFLLSIFPLYLTISVFWSANPLRGLLTAGVMWAVFFAVFSLLFIVPQTGAPRRLRTHVLLTMFISTVIVCKFCYVQSIMDTLGLSRDTTLLCPGCTYCSFGFPHPSGFAIEPQFMGNLLLAPTLTALYLVAFRSRKFASTVIHEASHLEDQAEHNLLRDKVHLPEVNWKLWQRIGMVILSGFLSMTLFFTFSRGAIYAYVIAIFVMLVFTLKRHQFRWSLITIPIVSFLLSLSLQGTFAAVGPTAETFFSGVAKSVHQLSLGLIDFRSQSVENSSTNGGKPVNKSPQNVDKIDQAIEDAAEIIDQEINKEETKLEDSAENTLDDAIFEGYVPESTNIRLGLNRTAIWTWLSAPFRTGTFYIGLDCTHSSHPECSQTVKLTPTSVLFGVGLGGAGTAMNAKYPDRVTSPKEIVQHQGFSLLLETGLVGMLLAIFGLLVVFAPQIFTRRFLDGKNAARESNGHSSSAKNALSDPKFAQEGPSNPKPSSHTALSIKAPKNAPNKPATLKSQAIPAAAASSTAQATKAATKSPPSPFWRHPALPLLLSLIIAYVITLNFFSGLPNALQIYLMPPLLYLIFSDHYRVTTA